MKFEKLIQSLSTKRNGQWFKLTWKTEPELNAKAKKDGHKVLKITTSTIRKGIKYSNTKAYKNKMLEKALVANSCYDNYNYNEKELDLKNSLPWGQWKKGYEKLIVEHTNKKDEYNQYLRIYTSPNKAKAQYFLNGNLVSKEYLKSLDIVQNSYWNKTEVIDVMTINIDNVLTVF